MDFFVEFATCCTTVQERQAGEVANESNWPTYKTEGCRYNWVAGEHVACSQMLGPEEPPEHQGAALSGEMNPSSAPSARRLMRQDAWQEPLWRAFGPWWGGYFELAAMSS